MAFSRRSALVFGAVALGGGFVALNGQALFYGALRDDFGGALLSAPEAHQMAQVGQITLVDIRSPSEWAASGSPAGALRLDMRRDDFTDALLAQVQGQADAPIALICARGVRSARLGNRLRAAGFTQVSDVPEGMFGNGAGPGWVRHGLPISRH